MHPAAAGPQVQEPACAFSVDVEDYFQVHAFERYVSCDEWERYPSRVESNTQRLLDLCDETHATGTFFVLGWLARRHPALVREITARGHEVASHGMAHRMITRLSPEEFRRDAGESRQLLEDVSGARVRGFRAPSYSVTERTLWALDVLLEAGYEYDSSIYPIRRRRYGYPKGPVRPERLAGTRGTIVEFPLPTIPFGPLRLPVLAGAYLRLLPLWVSRAALHAHVSRNIPVVVNIHPWEIDPAQPTVGPSRFRTWTHYTRLGHAEGIVRRVLQDARFRGIGERLRELGLLDPEPVSPAEPCVPTQRAP